MPTKILAIDDSKTMRLAIKITFAAEDVDVTSVSKGSEAVARAKQMGAEVVLVDATLAAGEPSGYDVCRALKDDPATAGIPVVLLVSNQGGVDQSKLRAAGGDSFIAKPFDSQELIDKVGEVIGKPVSKPAAAARPAKPAAAAAKPAPAPRPAAKPAARAPLAPPPGAGPAARPAAKPVQAAQQRRPAMTQPAPSRAAAHVAPSSGGDIPIAIPIPFTSADAPTPGIVERLKNAQSTAGLDPKVAEALVNLSKEVIEAVVWEVVPDLAEELIKKQAQARAKSA